MATAIAYRSDYFGQFAFGMDLPHFSTSAEPKRMLSVKDDRMEPRRQIFPGKANNVFSIRHHSNERRSHDFQSRFKIQFSRWKQPGIVDRVGQKTQ
jgi:hypothetical protein